jgi:hypothetical protein
MKSFALARNADSKPHSRARFAYFLEPMGQIWIEPAEDWSCSGFELLDVFLV